MSEYIRAFGDIGLGDVPLVGGKNASRGELHRVLAPKGIRVPDGFAVTARGYHQFLRSAGLVSVIDGALADLDTRDLEALRRRGHILATEEALAKPVDERQVAMGGGA